MIYKASLDTAAKIVTFTFSCVIAILVTGQIFLISTGKTVLPVTAAGLLFIVYTFLFLFRPLRYELTTEELIIHRPLKNVRIGRSDIEKVTLLDEQNMKGVYRTFGVGGVFGYFGQFSAAGIGSMTLYATRMNNFVLVIAGNKKIIITPDEAEGFATEALKH